MSTASVPEAASLIVSSKRCERASALRGLVQFGDLGRGLLRLVHGFDEPDEATFEAHL
jgi:hypothetical protein